MYEIFEQLLQKFGVTTADVCKATGIGQSTMSNWKNRRNLISGKNAQLIADYFKVSVDYLMTGELKRSLLDSDEVAMLVALAEENGYEVNESLNADMGVTLTIKAPNQEQSIDLRNHEIKELINKMKNFALESMENMINQKYVNGEYHRERTGEELVMHILGDDRSKEDALAELSTYEDAEIVSFIRKANELKKQKLNAAHTRTDVTPSSEDILHDEDLMDDDDF